MVTKTETGIITLIASVKCGNKMIACFLSSLVQESCSSNSMVRRSGGDDDDTLSRCLLGKTEQHLLQSQGEVAWYFLCSQGKAEQHPVPHESPNICLDIFFDQLTYWIPKQPSLTDLCLDLLVSWRDEDVALPHWLCWGRCPLRLDSADGIVVTWSKPDSVAALLLSDSTKGIVDAPPSDSAKGVVALPCPDSSKDIAGPWLDIGHWTEDIVISESVPDSAMGIIALPEDVAVSPPDSIEGIVAAPPPSDSTRGVIALWRTSMLFRENACLMTSDTWWMFWPGILDPPLDPVDTLQEPRLKGEALSHEFIAHAFVLVMSPAPVLSLVCFLIVSRC